MARLVLVDGTNSKHKSERTSSGSIGTHRNAATEGESVKQLLEANGFRAKGRTTGTQFEFRCPFHEGPGELGRKPTNFYVNKQTGTYYCQAASCMEKGNLVTLERFFGVDADPSLKAHFVTKEEKLREFEEALTPSLRQVLHEKGLTDSTIERFRIGWDSHQGCYVIPYLEGRRPRMFRFYNPNPGIRPDGSKELKYWWEKGSEASLFNAGDAVGDADGRVFICEGEFKAMLLSQMGFAAVSVPGASIWKPEWSQAFNHARFIHVTLDNDNPEFHMRENCHKCGTIDKDQCAGHNPGQEAASKLTELLGYRAKNVVLPRPDGERKVDINEYFMRDGYTKDDFTQLVFDLKESPFLARSLADMIAEPPPEAQFVVAGGILSKGGRLLISGAPKVGKSIFVENLALSISAGIPFLRMFGIDDEKPYRVLLLDRELSERSLYDRLQALVKDRPGYQAAVDNLLIDQTTLFKLDQPGAKETLLGMIRANNVDVIIFDTAYKFFSGDIESAKNVSKAFDTLDQVIAETGVSVVLTHHHRKKPGDRNGKVEAPDPDSVAGSFLWTGWPNATVLINFMNRTVESPFNTVATFTAFRDAAPPDPLALYRTRESISYSSITPYSFDEFSPSAAEKRPLNYVNLADQLLGACPVPEDDFLHMASAIFGAKQDTIRPMLLDLGDQHPDFERTGSGTRADPYIWRFTGDIVEETFEEMLAREEAQ